MRRNPQHHQFRHLGQENLPSGGSSLASGMGAKFGTAAANDNAKSFVTRAARDFRRLRLTVFGRGRLAEERAAEALGCAHRTLQNWESGHTKVPHSAVLRLRELLREVAA